MRMYFRLENDSIIHETQKAYLFFSNIFYGNVYINLQRIKFFTKSHLNKHRKEHKNCN